jgi:hypothetical protein
LGRKLGKLEVELPKLPPEDRQRLIQSQFLVQVGKKVAKHENDPTTQMSLVSQLSSQSENGNDEHKKWFSISSSPKGYPKDVDGKNPYIKELHLSRINVTLTENQCYIYREPINPDPDAPRADGSHVRS